MMRLNDGLNCLLCQNGKNELTLSIGQLSAIDAVEFMSEVVGN